MPLQWHGFNESTPSKWRAALLVFALRPLSKGLIKSINYSSYKLISINLCVFSNLACPLATMVTKTASIAVGGGR